MTTLRKFQIFYYDVPHEIISMPDRETAVRYMGIQYGGLAGMRVVEIEA